jgi:hypothetical protein
MSPSYSLLIVSERRVGVGRIGREELYLYSWRGCGQVTIKCIGTGEHTYGFTQECDRSDITSETGCIFEYFCVCEGAWSYRMSIVVHIFYNLHNSGLPVILSNKLKYP